jgi:hypothetical protein
MLKLKQAIVRPVTKTLKRTLELQAGVRSQIFTM